MNTMSSFRQRATRVGAYALAALMISAGITSCGKKGGESGSKDNEAAGDPVTGDWVIVHALSDAESLNLITATDATSQELHGYMYETLTSTDPYTLETIPWIADSVGKISEDRLSYEFRLRKDAKFNDGKPVTGEDFIFYLKCIKNPLIENAAPLRGYYSRVDRLELINGDKYHLRAVMNEPYYLGEQFIGGMYAFPKHIWDPQNISDKFTFEELNKNDPNKNPAIQQMADIIEDVQKNFDKKYLIGSGSYQFDEFRRNERISLVRSPNYWNKAHKYGAAYPDKIVYRTINDPNAAVAALKSGEIDFQPVMEKVNFNQERNKLPEYKLKPAIYDYPAYSYIGYNEQKPIFKDKLVRQALSRALDRESIIKTIYFGMARPVQSPLFYKRPECDTTLPIIKYNLDEAKKLLTQAGWSDSDGDGIIDKVIDGKKTDLRFKILLNSGNKRREQTALIFVDALKKLGIDAGTTSLEWATFLQRTRDGDFDAFVGGWAMSVLEGDMYQIWHSKSAEQGGSNHIHYANPQVDQLIETIRGEFDYNKRKEMLKQIQQIIHDDQPVTFLVSEKLTGAYSDRYQNVEFIAPRPCYNASWWWVPKSAQKYKSTAPTTASAN